MVEDEALLLAVLNSAPVVAGARTDGLLGVAGAQLARRFGGTGSETELAHLRAVRDAVQAVVRGRAGPDATLGPLLGHAVLVPSVTRTGITWELETPEERRLAVRALLAWAAVVELMPGRLRACANSDCNLFLVDHSRPGTARWCSMATCGNRAKARTHARRRLEAAEDRLP